MSLKLKQVDIKYEGEIVILIMKDTFPNRGVFVIRVFTESTCRLVNMPVSWQKSRNKLKVMDKWSKDSACVTPSRRRNLNLN